MLESEHLILRAIEPSDLEYLYKEENNTEIWGVSHTMIPFSKRTLGDYVNSVHDIVAQKQFRFMIIHKDSNDIIGMIDLFEYDPVNSRVGVGIIITDKLKRKCGFAKESLILICEYVREILRLNQIYCSMMKSNLPSQCLFESVGFLKVGERKNWFKTETHHWEDELLYQKILH